MRALLSRVISATPLAYWPVIVRAGAAKGARWTLAPFSSNWRYGGEADLAAGLAALDPVEGAVCWDFGAHFGIHTVGMAMQTGPCGQVVAFEPDPVAFRRLHYHVGINKLHHVVLYQAAASFKTGQQQLVFDRGLGSSISRIDDEPTSRSIHVKTLAPDDLVAQNKIRLPNLIKVDVEGHGAQALSGSLKSISASLPVIIFSNHSAQEKQGARDLLQPLGYVCQSGGIGYDIWKAIST